MSIIEKPTEKWTTHHSETEFRRISLTLIDFVADCLGVDPTETNLDLHEHVGLDELDRVYENMDSRNDHAVVFPYEGYCVTVCLSGKMMMGEESDCLNEKGILDSPTSKV